MRILHIIDSMDPARGGPVEQILLSADSMRALGHESEVASLDRPDDPWNAAMPLPHHAQGHWIRRYGYSPAFRRWVRDHQHHYDVAIIHGLWTYATVAAAHAFRRGGLPYLVFSHGMLDPWFGEIDQNKHIAKQVYWWCTLATALRGAYAVLFTTAEEQRLAQGAFRGGSYAGRVVTYGTADVQDDLANQIEAFRAVMPRLGGRPFLLFLSRLHRKKGCDLLIEAFARCSARHDFDLVMAGPDQSGWRRELEDLCRRHGIADRVHWPGMLTGDAKWGAFRICDAFILPSHQENFGIVVAEAMACAKPVLITDKVNIWEVIEQAGAGMIASDDTMGIVSLIDRFQKLDETERRTMGHAARLCFEEHFGLAAATQDLEGVLIEAIEDAAQYANANMPNPIIIYRLGSLGDTVVALPCFNLIAVCFADHERIALTNEPVAAVAAPLNAVLGPEGDDGGLIHRSIAYPVGLRSIRRLFLLARCLRATKAETLIYLGTGRPLLTVWRDLLFFRACGIKRIIGAPTTRSLNDGDLTEGRQEHEAARLARCLHRLGPIDLTRPASWDMHLTPHELDAADRLIGPSDKPLIAINTGGKAASKDWGQENWLHLLRQIAKDLNADLLIVGSPQENDRAEALAKMWPRRTINACGLLTPRETAAALRRTALFIGHDSGPMHLAAAQGVRCVALFGVGPAAGKWYPFGPGHQILHSPAGVRHISVEQVCAAVFQIASEEGLLEPTIRAGEPTLIE